ncbi:helix-turn-helix domain-containing protein [Pinibacter soli]|uniref:Helix-turn-helix domain-containing protein n=1 Tax=Pinibacter soli TaxID=3044211 RepID=A0ABT6RFT5_9BACT|nr:helix-turn-helix domain-containing protein [Pinibacter soli]MDI3321240.1 helix-turn-helix domain-containing protein [Pinibacter soli]
MISVIVLICIIVQTAISIYLLNVSGVKDDFDKNIYKLLFILLCHLSIKCFILAVMKNEFLYGKIASGFGLCYGPLLYITALSFTGKKVSAKQSSMHFFPFLLFSIFYLSLMIGRSLNVVSPEFIITYTTYYKWLVTASLISYPVATIRHLNVRGASLDANKKSLLNSIAYILAFGILFGIFLIILHTFELRSTDLDIRIAPYICFALIPIAILKYKLAQRFSVAVPEKQDTEPVVEKQPQAEVAEKLPEKRYLKSALDEKMMDEYEVKLIKYMLQSKVYLDTELSLDDLAHKIKIPKHHITQLLNDRLLKNFYSFINEYRIEEAMQKLRDPDVDVNMLSLAFDCGFNSKSSFNTYFKKITGVTPSAYRKKMLVCA